MCRRQYCCCDLCGEGRLNRTAHVCIWCECRGVRISQATPGKQLSNEPSQSLLVHALRTTHEASEPG
jgi:hypothetical protein